MLNFERYIVKKSTKWSFSGFGSVKKRFFMAKSCLEHIPKLILIGKSMANCIKYWSRKSVFFQIWLETMLKDAPWCWSFSILNDDTKCLVWWVNNRNTEAQKARPKIMCFLRMAGNHLKRCALMRWSFSILNDNTKCLVWWVNNRNTEAKKH